MNTEAQNLAEQFQMQCERFLATCPVALCLARFEDGRILKINERFLIMANRPGASFEEIAACSLSVRTDSLDAAGLKKRLKEIPMQRNLKATFQLDDHSPPVSADASISVFQFKGEDCMLVFLEEQTESKKVEHALAAARDAAIESARLKSEFLANISHEIRTPLNGVIGMTYLLLDTKLGSLQRNFAETIRISADNLLNLINEILDYSKLEAGKLVVNQAPFNLLATIENTLDLMAERAHTKRLELTYLVAPDVPTQVIGDEGRCRQILTNLIGNAIKFTNEGEVSLRVKPDPETDQVRFEIRDSGIGIPSESLPDLFQAFHQVDSSSNRKFEGTGLGLAISRQLVEVMGGSIGVISTVGEGSRFWFTLPLRPQEDAAPRPAIPEKLKDARVLLVENNQTNAENIVALLEHAGASIKRIAHGTETLEALRQGTRNGAPYDVAIIDLDTPDVDGLTLAKGIKADPTIASTNILILTTVTHQVETQQLSASHIGACLTKPVKQSRLLDYVTAAMNKREDNRPPSARLPDIGESEGKPHVNPVPPPLRIIIAEDNSINQKVAKGLLARLGYVVDVVSDGRSLLRELEVATRDVVFMDCQLPEMDGLAATRELRNREKNSDEDRRTYVIAMTADAVPGARERCLSAGMDDYLSKPIRMEELQAVLRRATEYVHIAANKGQRLHPHGFLDPTVMETLRLLKSPGELDPLPLLIDEFVDAAQHRLEELQSAVIERDLKCIERSAHGLRGSAAGIGALRLAELSAELEHGIRNGSYNTAAAVLSQMDEEFLLVKNTLEFEKTR